MMSGISRIGMTTALMMFALAAKAESPSVWLRADLFSSTRHLDDRQGAGSVELGSRYNLELNESQSIDLDARAIAQGPDSQYLLRVQSAYWQYWSDSFTLRVGQQRLSFGRADGINPTDYFTAHDYRLLQPFEEDERRSLAAIKWEYSLSDSLRLVSVLAPDFVASKIPLPAALTLPVDEPDAWRHPQYAAKLDYASTRWDWSLSAFNGFQTLPLFQPDANNGLQQAFVPMRALGLDAARTLGEFNLRAEMAWWDPSPEANQLPVPRQLFAVVGGDRGSDTWNINLQLIYRRSPDNLNPQLSPLQELGYRQNLHLLIQEQAQTWGMSGRWWFANATQTWRAELLLLHYVKPDNSSLRPQISHDLTDRTHLTFGAQYQLGNRTGALGQLKPNNTIYLDLKHFLQ